MRRAEAFSNVLRHFAGDRCPIDKGPYSREANHPGSEPSSIHFGRIYETTVHKLFAEIHLAH
jgi:hypothetical protein